jgi:hypothetical protein
MFLLSNDISWFNGGGGDNCSAKFLMDCCKIKQINQVYI